MIKQEIKAKVGQWAWLADTLNCDGVLKHYEAKVGEIYSDIYLINKKDHLEFYLITRTSDRCYRTMHYNHGRIIYRSFTDASKVSDYIYSNYLLMKYGRVD